jgi:precorrin-2 dehydrogenase/sirohydrochlorin ferrochelatase
MMIFLTGVGARFLMSEAEDMGVRDEFLSALKRLTVVARGPKPLAALTRAGIAVHVSPKTPTSEGIVETLRSHDLKGHKVGVQLYGTPNPFLCSALESGGAQVRTVSIYTYGAPSDSEAIASLIDDIIGRRIHVITFTSAPQVRFLFETAENIGRGGELTAALNDGTVVAAIGEVTSRALRNKGVRPGIVPVESKMAAMVSAVAGYFRERKSVVYYPVFLDLTDRHVVVVGGGAVAERKVTALLDCGARTKVISPDLTPTLQSMAESGKIEFLQRQYAPGDLQGAYLVIAATSDPAVQEVVWKDAQDLNILINTADEPALCNVIMPAVVRQGDLTLAISTGGKSPALASRLRRQLEETFGREYAVLLRMLGEIRPDLRQRFTDIETRKALHYRIIDSDVLSLLKQNDEAAAEKRIREIIEKWKREEPAG